jgi:hypothetical protein
MNQQFRAWLNEKMPFPGLAAWCVRFPDQSLAHSSYVNWLNKPQLEQALVRLVRAAERFEHFQSRRLCWNFEHLRIYFASRQDGAALALFVERRPEALFDSADNLVQEFAREV